MQQHRRSDRAAGGQPMRGLLRRYPAPARHTLVIRQQRTEHVRIVCGIEHAHAVSEVDTQPHLANLALDHRAPAEQDRSRHALIDERLRRAQHALILAFAIDDAPR